MHVSITHITGLVVHVFKHSIPVISCYIGRWNIITIHVQNYLFLYLNFYCKLLKIETLDNKILELCYKLSVSKV